MQLQAALEGKPQAMLVEMYCAIPLTTYIDIHSGSGKYRATLAEWNGVFALGVTASEAILNLAKEKRVYVSAMLAKGQKPFLPQTKIVESAMEAFIQGWIACESTLGLTRVEVVKRKTKRRIFKRGAHSQAAENAHGS